MLFLICSATVLAPTSRLLAFNAGYFRISAFEFLVSALCIGLALAVFFFAIVLLVSRRNPLEARLFGESSGKHAAGIVHFFLLLLLSCAVLYSFVIPIQLTALDGPTGFEIRREALYGSTAALGFFVVIVASRRVVPRIFSEALGTLKTLLPFQLLYVAGFTVYSITGIPFLGLTNTTKSISEFNIGKENTFILSFDQVQGSFMGNVLENDSKAQDIFQGFTFYPGAASTYPNTNYSISSMPLGRRAVNATETHRQALQSPDSLLAVASASGVRVHVDVDLPELREHPYECLICHEDGATFNYGKSFELLRHAANIAFGMDIHRAIPKGLISRLGTTDYPIGLSEHHWKFDLHELKNLVDVMEQGTDEKNLYFMHFLGTHQPFTYRPDCSIMSEEETSRSQNSQGAVDSVYCVLGLVEAFLTKLRNFGAYDDSLIFVISDHGYEHNTQLTGPFFDYFPDTVKALGDPRNIKSAGAYNPILFFKPRNASGPMRISTDPASLIDIPPTICASLNCDASRSWSGFNLVEEAIPAERERDFWMYVGTADRRIPGGGDKLHDGLDEYWEARNFSGPLFPNLALVMGLNRPHTPRPLEAGEAIVFSASGNSDDYVRDGWHPTEDAYRWTDGERAVMFVKLAAPVAGDLTLSFKLRPYQNEAIEYQDVKVAVNGESVATWRVTGKGEYSAIIPGSLVSDGELKITLDIGSPTAPCRTGASTDCRVLGVAAKKLAIRPKGVAGLGWQRNGINLPMAASAPNKYCRSS